MSKFTTALAALSILSAGAAFAQTTVSKAESRDSGRMAPGQKQASTNMTHAQKTKWKACQGMTDSQQANDKACVKLKDMGAGIGNEGMTNDGLPKGK